MAGPSGSTPAPEGPAPEAIAELLTPALGRRSPVTGLHRLTSGASRETWALRAGDAELILRRDPPGRPGAPGAMRREAEIMAACGRAGLAAPEVLAYDDGARLGTPGLVMRRVPGETIPKRILREEAYAGARRVLVHQLGEFLAGLHALDPSAVPDAPTPDPLAVWERYHQIDDSSPTFERAYEWLRAAPPPRRSDVLVHGDLRVGNIIVDRDGLAAVIDWELIHLGDPLEDLAWLSLKAWRFGAAPEVGGLGTLDELVAAYERAGGRPVDRDALHWWLVLKTLVWGIGCMLQAHVHLTGGVRSVDLAAVGRRVAEQEWDLLELLAPEACAAARAAPARPAVTADRGYGRPTAPELLEAVRELLTVHVVPAADRGLSYQARVAANILDIVGRELTAPPVELAGDGWDALALAVRARLEVSSPRHLGS